VDGGGPKAEEAGGNPKAAAGAWVDGHDIRNKAGKSVDVGGEEVWRKRDAPELEPERLRESVARKRLREARHAFEEDVSVGDHGEDEAVDELFLPDDDLANLIAYLRHELLLRGDPVRCFLQVHFISPCVV
jgi:hypothetical protein